jgi:dienelactone hydrolase
MIRFLSILAASTSIASAILVENPVIYEQGGVKMEGQHFFDDGVQGKRPGVLVIHQWTGLGKHEMEVSRQLAFLGYNVIAADIYGQGVRPKPPASGKEAGKYKGDRQLFRDRLNAALEVLKADELTDPTRVGAVGYCFGGMGVLELAREGADLQGVVSIHGSLDAAPEMAAPKGGVKAKVLVLHGADDPHAPLSQVEALKKEMSDAGADLRVVLYPGAVHAYTEKTAGDDPSKGVAYNKEADEGSWKELTAFFKQIFAKE